MIELKVVLCLVARRFEIRDAYAEVDALEERKRGGWKSKGTKMVDGERAYQVGKGEPSGFLPVRVREVKVEVGEDGKKV